MTMGEERVRISFNPNENKSVTYIKTATAALIDDCESYKINGETARLASLAQTAYEEAAMWAVKAATLSGSRW